MHACTWWVWTGRYTEYNGAVSSPVLRSLETTEECSQRDLPVGACWAAPRSSEQRRLPYEKWEPAPSGEWPPTGADGLSIVCKLPDGHHWRIDSRCSNCTLPDDATHRCWVRHGTVGEPLTVDKQGLTCAAGAGSIQTGGYHGFLQNGHLT